MALTRKFLKAMGIEDDKIDQIVEAHSETIDGLKADLSKYKTEAEKLSTVQKELDDLKALGTDDYKEKYESLQKDFDSYKSAQVAKETKKAKEAVYEGLLKKAGVSEKRIASIIKISDLEKMKLTDGKLSEEDEKTMLSTIKEEYSDFIVQQQQSGAKSPNPPKNNDHQQTYTMADIKNMSPAQINENWDAVKASLKNGG